VTRIEFRADAAVLAGIRARAGERPVEGGAPG
jgi:hypothetical protein